MYCLWNVGETKIDRGKGNQPARSFLSRLQEGRRRRRRRRRGIPPPKINIVYLGDAFDRMENRDRRVRSTCTGSVSRPISTNVCQSFRRPNFQTYQYKHDRYNRHIRAGRTRAARDTIRKEIEFY